MKTTVSGLLLDSKGLHKPLQDWQLLKDLGLISLEKTSSAIHGLRSLEGLFCLEKAFLCSSSAEIQQGEKIARLGITSKLPHIRNPEEINIY